MLEREAIIAELWRRIDAVNGVVFTARNPASPPSKDDFPAIQFFELDDLVTDSSMRGGYPVYRRELDVAIEFFVAGTIEVASSKELGQFVQAGKTKLYEGGPTLGRRWEFKETTASRVLRPPVGKHSAGIGIVIVIKYIEDVSRLMS